MSTSPVPRFWLRWMQTATLALALFGVAMVVVPVPVQTVFNFIIYQQPTLPAWANPDAAQYITFMYAVLGGVMFGWMLAVYALVQTSFRRGEREGWLWLVITVVGWYVVDSYGSIITGFWQNAVSNTGFLILFAIPLAATYRHFFPSREQQRAAA